MNTQVLNKSTVSKTVTNNLSNSMCVDNYKQLILAAPNGWEIIDVSAQNNAVSVTSTTKDSSTTYTIKANDE